MVSVALLVLFWCWSVSAQSAVTVYATDSRLVYNGPWSTQTAGSLTYKSTTTEGSSVSLTFQGTSVNWWSRINPNAGNLKLTVDGKLVLFSDPSAGFVNTSQPSTLTEMYPSGGMLNGTYTITATSVAPGVLGGTRLEHFYFIYIPDENGSPAGPPVTSVAASAITTIASLSVGSNSSITSHLDSNPTLISATTAIVTSSATATTTATNGNDTLNLYPANSPSDSLKRSVIVGSLSALGAIVALCLLASLIIYLVRRRRREQEKAENAVRVAIPFAASGDYHLLHAFSSKERLLGQEAGTLEKSGNPLISDTSNAPGPSSAVTPPTMAVTPPVASVTPPAAAVIPPTISVTSFPTDLYANNSEPPPAYS